MNTPRLKDVRVRTAGLQPCQGYRILVMLAVLTTTLVSLPSGCGQRQDPRLVQAERLDRQAKEMYEKGAYAQAIQLEMQALAIHEE